MKFMLVGDTNIQNRDKPVEAFQHVRDLLRGSDVLLGQAEGMFTPAAGKTPGGELSYKPLWRHSHPAMAGAFVEAGFSGVSMASNVSADRQAVCDSLDVAGRIGLGVCGIGRNRAQARAPLVVAAGGQRVAMLSRTSVFWPHLVAAGDDLPGAATVKVHTAYVPGRRALEMPGAPPDVRTWADEQELADLLADIQVARAQADVVFLSMHWGISSSWEIVEYQRQIGCAAIDVGTDVVFGHHAHRIQPIELHRGRPIFYGLGNFAFDWTKMLGRAREGLVVRGEITRGRIDCTLVPVQRDETNHVAPLSAASDSWRAIAAFLHDHADDSLRRRLTIERDAITLRTNW